MGKVRQFPSVERTVGIGGEPKDKATLEDMVSLSLVAERNLFDGVHGFHADYE